MSERPDHLKAMIVIVLLIIATWAIVYAYAYMPAGAP